jgi:hypothetical protein
MGTSVGMITHLVVEEEEILWFFGYHPSKLS